MRVYMTLFYSDQAFILIDVKVSCAQIRSSLMELYQDTQSPPEKRIAAYLVLMKKPDRALLRDLVSSLVKERDEQLRSFVVSHLHNILSSDDPQMLQ